MSRRVSPARITPLLTAALAAAPAFAVAAPALAAPDERIAALAAGARELFALRANRLVSFDAAGREIARCPRFETPAPERARHRAAAPPPIDVDEALRLAGLPDDDADSDEAEEVLDDEGLLPQRRPRSQPGSEPGIVAHDVAASPTSNDAWIATSSGVYRGRGGSCARFALPGRDVVAVAAGDHAVAAATADLVWRSDGSGPFRVAAGVTARPRALAVVDAEHTLVATDDAVVEIGPYGVARQVLDHGSDALAVCGGVTLALADDGVWTWSGDQAPARAGDRPPARLLACGAGAAPRFIAAGAGVYTSEDGAVWREPPALLGRSIGAVATLAGDLWVAVDGDLLPADGVPAPRPRVPAPATPLPGLPPLQTRRLIEPSFPWPQLTLVLAGQRTPVREGWSVVVLVAFRFGRPGGAGTDRQQLAAELVRRDAALAAEERALAIPPDDDPSRNARLRALREEREALR